MDTVVNIHYRGIVANTWFGYVKDIYNLMLQDQNKRFAASR